MTRRYALTLVLCVAFAGFIPSVSRAAAPLPGWVPDAVQTLSEVVQAPVEYLQNGPQNVFYLDTLPRDKEGAILRALSMFRPQLAVGGAVVLLGLEPEAAYWATPTIEPAWLSNTTMLGMYASMVDGGHGSPQGRTLWGRRTAASRARPPTARSCGAGRTAARR